MGYFELCVYGRVQGVGFRKRIKDFANNLKLKGFVQNNPDGSVSIFVQEGNKNKKGLDGLSELINFLNSNPGFSKVRNLDIRETNLKEKIKDLGFGGKSESTFGAKKETNFDKIRGGFGLVKYLLGLQSPRNYLDKIPKHVIIIPDGNRRWARKRGLYSSEGHYKAGSYENLERLFKEAKNLGIKYISIWGFSTENWKRGPKEIKEIFNLIYKRVKKFRQDAHKNKIRFRHFGRKDRIPKKLALEISRLEAETKGYSDFNVQLCLDYGGRDEIIRAVKTILKTGKRQINEKLFSEFLDSRGVDDPDLIIRTSGEKRNSGIMPFQSIYAEFYFINKHFPDFTPLDLRKAVKDFSKRKRRFGGN